MTNLKVTFKNVHSLEIVREIPAYRSGFDPEEFGIISGHVSVVYPEPIAHMVNLNIEHIGLELVKLKNEGDIGWAKPHTIIVPTPYDGEMNYDKVVVELDV